LSDGGFVDIFFLLITVWVTPENQPPALALQGFLCFSGKIFGVPK
jgi:hypothetical protein